MKQTNSARINRNSGMGGFLNPPTHPEHSISVESIKRDDFCMSLSSAVESDWLSPYVRELARDILNAWVPPALESPAIQEWIAQVLGYFRGCYVGQDKQGNRSWNASDLRISQDADPVLGADLHAGVHLIRKYYPEFTPTPAHFAGAYWGTKKVEKSA